MYWQRKVTNYMIQVTNGQKHKPHKQRKRRSEKNGTTTKGENKMKKTTGKEEKTGTEVAKHIDGMLTRAEDAILKTAVTTGYDTAMKAAVIYEKAIVAIFTAHGKDTNVKTPADVKKMILAATRRMLLIKNEKEDTEDARKYRAFARFCNQSFNWTENRKKTAIEFKQEKTKTPAEGEGQKEESKPKDNKKKIGWDELKELIKNGDKQVIDAILGLFTLQFLEEYITVKRAEAAAGKKTVPI